MLSSPVAVSPTIQSQPLHEEGLAFKKETHREIFFKLRERIINSEKRLSISNPDVLIATILNRDPEAQVCPIAKVDLLSSLSKSIARPETIVVGMSSSEENEFVDVLAMLHRHKAIYIKPSGRGKKQKCSEGAGLVRISMSDNGMIVDCAARGDYVELLRDVRRIDQISCNHSGLSAVFKVDDCQAVLPQVLKTLPGQKIVEAEIDIPLIDGKTWEISTLVVNDSGEIKTVVDWAKLGKSHVCSNIAKGGQPLKTDLAIQLAAIDLGLDPVEAGQSISDVRKKIAKLSIEVVESIDALLVQTFSAHLISVPASFCHAREVRVDTALTWDSEKREFSPILIEPQYPSYGAVSLESLDPQEYRIMTQIRTKNRSKAMQEIFASM